MTPARWTLRILKWIGVSLTALILLLAIAVQAQQWLLRWRAQRLMADMHQIRLYQTTWSDAQKLMHKWGAWGHYDGACTAEDCQYEIGLTDLQWSDGHSDRPAWTSWLMLHDRFDVYSRFGGRAAKIFATFIVHDGKIWRESMGIAVSLPKWQDPEKPVFEKTLWVRADSRQKLRNTRDNPWVLGNDEQLAEHPYYKAGRPGGCKLNCQAAEVTFSTRAPQEEIERLSSYNFSCLTRYFACNSIEELLPAATPWHLYHEDEFTSLTTNEGTAAQSCKIPLWAMARDQQNILFGEFRGDVTRYAEGEYLSTVHFRGSLKGEVQFTSDPAAIVSSVQVDGPSPPVLSKRYILFPLENYHGRTENLGREVPLAELPRCSIWDDTPENRREVAKGLAMNDNLRGLERW